MQPLEALFWTAAIWALGGPIIGVAFSKPTYGAYADRWVGGLIFAVAVFTLYLVTARFRWF